MLTSCFSKQYTLLLSKISTLIPKTLKQEIEKKTAKLNSKWVRYRCHKNNIRLYGIKTNDMLFFCKKGYMPNLEPSYSLASEEIKGREETMWQPDVYKSAHILADKLSAKYIIDIGSGGGKKLKGFEGQYKIIAVDYGDNKKIISDNLSDFMFIEANLENGLPKFDDAVLDSAIVIISDVVEHIVNPHKLLHDLSRVSKQCLAMLISTPDRNRIRGIEDVGPPPNPSHVREWSLKEFKALLDHYHFSNTILGHTRENDKSFKYSTALAIVCSSKSASQWEHVIDHRKALAGYLKNYLKP